MTRDDRAQALRLWKKSALASHFRSISGYVGGPVVPEKWSKDDLISDILQVEYPSSPAPAASSPAPQADAGAARHCAVPAPRTRSAVVG